MRQSPVDRSIGESQHPGRGTSRACRVGGVLLAHYYLPGTSDGTHQDLTPALYDERGPFRGVNRAGVLAWAAGIATYFAAGSIGGTVPALIVSIAVYIGLRRVIGR